MKAAATLTLVPLALAGCTVIFGGRPETCGRYPEGGGPAIIATRDEEVCEIVRLRVLRQLSGMTALQRDDLDAMLERLPSWRGKRDVDTLVAAIRRDAGDGLADDVRRAVDDVVAKSSRPFPADCDDVQRCLVTGAVRGIEIALLYTHPSTATPPSGQPDHDPGE